MADKTGKPNAFTRRHRAPVAAEVTEAPTQVPRGLRSAPVFRKAPSPTPHRLSIDVDNATYRALRIAAAERGTTIVALVRAAISERVTAPRDT